MSFSRSKKGSIHYKPGGKLEAGGYVLVGDKYSAKIQFIGNTEFAEGEWFGLEVAAPIGKNDGTVDGVKYFECKPKHGIFVRREVVKPIRPEDADSFFHMVMYRPVIAKGKRKNRGVPFH